MPTINVQVPALGESVSEATLIKWHKNDGEAVKQDEPICELETDKANVDVPSPGAGVIKRVKKEGDKVRIGETIATLDPSAKPSAPSARPASAGRAAGSPAPSGSNASGNNASRNNATPAAPAKPLSGAGAGAGAVVPSWAPPAAIPSTPGPAEASPAEVAVATAPGASSSSSSSSSATAVAEDRLSPAVRRLVDENALDPAQIRPTGPNGRLTKEDVQRYIVESRRQRDRRVTDAESGEAAAVLSAAPSVSSPSAGPASAGRELGVAAPATPSEPGTRRVPMSKIRKRIAENLVRAQQTAAILTTFNEIDLGNVMALRSKYKETFEKRHGVGLGFMSFFARAVVLALKEFERVNASLDGDDIVYHDYVNLGIAVSTDRGLAVPVLRHVEQMSFAKLESEIKRLAAATRDGKLSLQELSGGTFTITNGGVFGSLLSTPILNPPQSGILGMHAIQKRPVVVADKIEIRPMMYVALSYDHRLVDGRESVSFLVRVKELLEDPARLMLEV